MKLGCHDGTRVKLSQRLVRSSGTKASNSVRWQDLCSEGHAHLLGTEHGHLLVALPACVVQAGFCYLHDTTFDMDMDTADRIFPFP